MRTVLQIALANPFPMLIWWGPNYVQIYNDAYRPIPGAKHPASMGQPASECWPEIWHILRPLVDTPFNGGAATWSEDLELEINRSGFLEETHFTVAYSPVPDETVPGGIGGVLATVHEITEKVIGQRRVTLLRDLGARAAEAKIAEQACQAAAATLANHAKDIPFALFYLMDVDGRTARLASSCGVSQGADISPSSLSLDEENQPPAWPLAAALRTGDMQVIGDLGAKFSDLPPGPWSEKPHSAAILPIPSTGHQVNGFVIAGLSARLALDESYKNFLELAASQIATAVGNACAYQEERKRAEALAEIDRAKTVFFSNVSHEFRTPLTLMVGPLETLLAKDGAIAPDDREYAETAYRNSLRLLKLVNSLLDFSRIEAGRVKACYEPVDLPALTTHLASNFRAAMEAAGLQFVVDCRPLTQDVYVDREMWEKIVLNLLSNAFKFTFAGRVMLTLEEVGNSAVLTVADTGTGIPEHELPRIFERFHRVEGAKGRTYEGTGIGLALIQELVKLHGGTIEVRSREGEGTAFAVALPFGSTHLPREHVNRKPANTEAGTSARADAFTAEAFTWMANEQLAQLVEERPNPAAETGMRPLILLADDNADVREHVKLILGAAYEVISIADGDAALKAAKARRPDLILSDIMMPVRDGFGLLQQVRDDPGLREIPVILLSARAGEEARTEGITAGANDYLTKPFSGRELVARISTTLNLTRVRQQAEAERRARAAQFETLVNQAPFGVFLLDSNLHIQRVNPTAQSLIGDIPDLIGRDFAEVSHMVWTKDFSDRIASEFRHTLQTGEPCHTPKRSAYRQDRALTECYEWRIDRIPRPEGDFGVVCYFRDISKEVAAREKIARSEERLSLAVSGAGMGAWDVDFPSGRAIWSREHYDMLGYTSNTDLEPTLDMWRSRVHPDDLTSVDKALEKALATGAQYASEHRIVRADTGEVRWLSEFGRCVRNADGEVVRFVGISFNITQRKAAEAQLTQSWKTFFELVERAPFGICVVDSDFRIAQTNNRSQEGLFANVRPAVGRDFAEAMRIPWSERVAGELVAAFRDTLETGEPYYSKSFVHPRKDAHTVESYEWELHRMTLPEGRHGVICYYFDSTELRKTETALRRANRDLEQFAYSASHDLQEPLRSIRIYSELLTAVLGDKLDGKTLGHLNYIQRGADRMDVLLRDLLAYTQTSILEQKPNEPVDANECLRLASANLAAAISESGAAIDNPALPRVRVGAIHLQQLFQNLISNAIKYRRPEVPPEIRVSAERQNGDWLFSVRDNGIGIEPRYKDHIFGLFKRLHGQHEYSGTGIGLALCARIVEQYNGRIWVESEPGAGSTFYFTLPA